MPDTSEIMEPFFRAIASAPLNIAPERSADLMQQIFENLQWRLVDLKASPLQQPPFSSDPPTKTITVTYSGLAMVWCIAYTSVSLYDVVVTLYRHDPSGGLRDIREAFAKLSRHLAYANRLRTEDADWPADLLWPEIGITADPWDRINNVFFGAVSWLLLHEIAHVALNHEEVVPQEMRIRQEIQADEFATKWIFDKVSTEIEREFRILVVGVALAWLLLFQSRGDVLHPPAPKRLRDVFLCVTADSNSIALEVVSHILKVLFFPNVTPPLVNNSEELFSWVLKQFAS
jgi:hypothetical protein